MGSQLKRELNNYEEIVEKLDGLLKDKELSDRNKRMETEKKEEELRMQKRYNEEELTTKKRYNEKSWSKKQKTQTKQKMIN